jgi:hypothetical protein
MVSMRRVLLSLVVLLLISLMGLSWASLSAQDAEGGTCPGSLAARLAVGGVGRVLPGEPNNIRIDPTTSAPRIGQILAGETFTIEDGPVCADGYTWWQVDLRGLVGWTPESGDGVYWLELVMLSGSPTPVIATGDCSGALPTRFVIGDQVRVRPTKANNVRENPTVSAKVTHKIAVGSSVILMNGPVCADGYTWWQIDDLGWTAESGDGEYWLEAFNTTPAIMTPGATPRPNPATSLLTPSASPAVPPTATSNVAALPDGLSIEPLWTETFDDNSAGWHEVPFDGYQSDEFLFREIKDGGYTMSRSHFGGLEQDNDALFLAEIPGLPDSLDTYALSVEVQSLTPESQSLCAMLNVNLEITESAMLLFCRTGLVTVISFADREKQNPAGYIMTGLPDPMDGEPHRLMAVSDGQTLFITIDGQGGLQFPYTRPLTAFGLAYYDPDQRSTLDLAVRFDTVEIGVPTFDETFAPAVTANGDRG